MVDFFFFVRGALEVAFATSGKEIESKRERTVFRRRPARSFICRKSLHCIVLVILVV